MAYSNAIAIGSGNLLYGVPTQRKAKPLTQVCVENALEVIEDYYSCYSMISEEEYDKAKEQINSAESDDEISGIVCRLRHKAYNNYERRCVYA